MATKKYIHIHFLFLVTLAWPLAQEARDSHSAKENYN